MPSIDITHGWYVVWYWDDGCYVNKKFMDYEDAVEFAKEHDDE